MLIKCISDRMGPQRTGDCEAKDDPTGLAFLLSFDQIVQIISNSPLCCQAHHSNFVGLHGSQAVLSLPFYTPRLSQQWQAHCTARTCRYSKTF